MDLRELESYRLSDAIKFNDDLNPRLWGSDEHLLPEVREKLMARRTERGRGQTVSPPTSNFQMSSYGNPTILDARSPHVPQQRCQAVVERDNL